MTPRESPGPRSRDHWRQEQDVIGPGLQAVVQWAELCFVQGRGALLTDIDDNVYIDFMGGAGVNSIGHAHPRFVEALSAQLQEWTIGSFASEARLRMLQTLKHLLPEGLDRVQL